MKIFIKYMVCRRCNMVIERELEIIGVRYTAVNLREVDLLDEMPSNQRDEFKYAISEFGLELFEYKKSVLIQNIKNVILDLIRYSKEPLAINLSTYVGIQLHQDNTYLTNLFSEVVGLSMK